MRRGGLFISFEGIEGTGKSTQARMLGDYLKGRGMDVVLTEEPGGTKIGRKIREVLLSIEHKEMDSMAELLLYNASRSQHIREVIMPSLNKGMVVITDRFTDSTFAYQGYGRGIDLNLIMELDRISTGGLVPGLTILLDIDVETGLKRNRGANKMDRLELEDVEFHKRVRNGYMRLRDKEPGRIRLIDAGGSVEEVHGMVVKEAMRVLE
jgi:dTMP kinase